MVAAAIAQLAAGGEAGRVALTLGYKVVANVLKQPNEEKARPCL